MYRNAARRESTSYCECEAPIPESACARCSRPAPKFERILAFSLVPGSSIAYFAGLLLRVIAKRLDKFIHLSAVYSASRYTCRVGSLLRASRLLSSFVTPFLPHNSHPSFPLSPFSPFPLFPLSSPTQALLPFANSHFKQDTIYIYIYAYDLYTIYMYMYMYVYKYNIGASYSFILPTFFQEMRGISYESNFFNYL